MIRKFLILVFICFINISTVFAVNEPQRYKTLEDFNTAMEKFKSSNVSIAYNEFEKIVEESPSDNDYINIVLSGKLSDIGFYNLADKAKSKIKDYELAEIPVIKDNLFDKSKKLKVLFIDEVSLFTESELKLISQYAVSHGIFVVGLGDPVQNSAKVYTDEVLTTKGITQKDKQKNWHSSGLEDCMYFGSSYLTASLRASNLAKYENFVLLSNALDNVMSEWKQKRESTFDELDAFVPEKINLHYYEDDNVFYGEKIVNRNTDLIPLAEKYSKFGQVTIITDDLNKYQSLPKNVEVKSYNDMQGMETDFVLVDVDFNKNNSFGGKVSKYSMLRDLYTL